MATLVGLSIAADAWKGRRINAALKDRRVEPRATGHSRGGAGRYLAGWKLYVMLLGSRRMNPIGKTIDDAVLGSDGSLDVFQARDAAAGKSELTPRLFDNGRPCSKGDVWPGGLEHSTGALECCWGKHRCAACEDPRRASLTVDIGVSQSMHGWRSCISLRRRGCSRSVHVELVVCSVARCRVEAGVAQ